MSCHDETGMSQKKGEKELHQNSFSCIGASHLGLVECTNCTLQNISGLGNEAEDRNNGEEKTPNT
jgi:hypothetical protein